MKKNNSIINIKPLGFPWETEDPFLFCAHHKDEYPKGNENLGPDVPLSERNIGQDFTIKDGWRMYHGNKVPGFPSHPHRGFETLTVVEEGLVDHADSFGGAGRYGMGDVQWLTAGKGVQHSEMFPLLNRDKENHLELFQIWLNLAKIKKYAEPHYTMFWSEDIPILHEKDESERDTHINLICGSLESYKGLTPPPDSWAYPEENQVLVLTVKMDSEAEWTLPAADSDVNRTLYFHKGSSLLIDGEKIEVNHSVKLNPQHPVKLKAGDKDSHILLLQGKPINEPLAQYGPFVMNTQNEIQQAFEDYEKTQFGGWPWKDYDQTHGIAKNRFALFPDGTEVKKD